MRFSPEGDVIASGSHDKHIFLWRTYGECENYMMLKGALGKGGVVGCWLKGALGGGGMVAGWLGCACSCCRVCGRGGCDVSVACLRCMRDELRMLRSALRCAPCLLRQLSSMCTATLLPPRPQERGAGGALDARRRAAGVVLPRQDGACCWGAKLQGVHE